MNNVCYQISGTIDRMLKLTEYSFILIKYYQLTS